MKHPLQVMMEQRRAGIRCGIPSYCTANELALEIALRRAKEQNKPVLIGPPPTRSTSSAATPA